MEIKEISLNEVKELRNNNYEYLVLQACGGDLSKWVDGITNIFKEEKVIPSDFTFNEVYTFQNDNLTNMLFALNSKDIDIGRLAILRLKMRADFGSMWLSDYIDNGYIKDITI